MSSRAAPAPVLVAEGGAEAALPLRVMEDYERLPPCSLNSFLADRPEARTTTLPAALIAPEALGPWLEARMGGPIRPEWRVGDGASGLGWRGESTVCRMRDVRWAPASGAVIDRHGVVIRCTIGEAEFGVGDLSRLPGFGEGPTGPVLALGAAPAPVFDRATVWLPWGGGFNYGHFLIDALSALLMVEELGLLKSHPAVAPPLTPWQRDLLLMAFPGRAVTEVAAPIAEIDEVLFSTAMNHFLHIPNAILGRLRDRILERAPPPAPGCERVYLSRRRTSMRVMVNEARLEQALRARGFRILNSETLSAAEQVAAVRGARVVVGASGAQLANALFMPTGACLIEIQPENFTSAWAPMMAWVTERDWAGYFTPSPLPPRRAPLLARMRRGFKFAWELPLDDFLPFLDARL